MRFPLPFSTALMFVALVCTSCDFSPLPEDSLAQKLGETSAEKPQDEAEAFFAQHETEGWQDSDLGKSVGKNVYDYKFGDKPQSVKLTLSDSGDLKSLEVKCGQKTIQVPQDALVCSLFVQKIKETSHVEKLDNKEKLDSGDVHKAIDELESDQKSFATTSKVETSEPTVEATPERTNILYVVGPEGMFVRMEKVGEGCELMLYCGKGDDSSEVTFTFDKDKLISRKVQMGSQSLATTY